MGLAGAEKNPAAWNRGRFTRLLLLCYLAFFSISTVLLISTRSYWSRGLSDFSCSYAAGTVVRAGNGANLYSYETQAQAQAPFRAVPLLFTHPPFETAIYAGMTVFSYRTAFLLWWAINHLLLLSFLMVIARTFPRAEQLVPVATLCFSIFMPLQFAFVNGQTSILVLMLCSLALSELLAERDFTAGILLSLAMVKPQMALPIFAITAIRSSRRFTLGFVAGLIGELIVSVLMVGVTGVRSYLPFLKFFGSLPDSVSGTHPEEMCNLRGLLFRLDLHSVTLLAALSVLTIVLAVVITRRSSIQVRFAVATIVGLLVSFHSLRHDQSLLILPFMIAMDQLIDRKIVGLKLVSTTLLAFVMIWSAALLLNPMITLVAAAGFTYALTLTDFSRVGVAISTQTPPES